MGKQENNERVGITFRRAGFLLLQLVVTAIGLFFVFRDATRRDEIWRALQHSDWRWLLLGWACYSLVEGLATVRWQLLLRVQGISLGWLRAGAIVIIGLFFNMFLPGLVGGDAMRLYFVFKEAPRKKAPAALSIAIDRLIGLVSIVILAGTVVVFRFHWLSRFSQTAHITYLALALLGGSLLLIITLFAVTGFGFLDRLTEQVPFRKGIIQAAEALRLYAARPGICLAALGLTVLSHLAYYVSYYCAARSLQDASGTTLGALDFISLMPLVNTITGVPISFGGVGVRENLFQKLLGDLAGQPAAVAALAASLGFAIQASWGVIGGAAYLVVSFARGNRGKSSPNSGS